MRSFPGSVAIIGFTGEVKFITRVGGFVLFTWAVKCTAVLPMNNRREASWKFTGTHRKRGNSDGTELSGTRPRPFSRRKLAGRSKVCPFTRARVLPGVNSLSEPL